MHTAALDRLKKNNVFLKQFQFLNCQIWRAIENLRYEEMKMASL